jgi:hypothetical protein
MKIQNNTKDNSGSSVTSVIIHDDIILTASAGCGQIVCQTKNGSFLKLSNPHNTQNIS